MKERTQGLGLCPPHPKIAREIRRDIKKRNLTTRDVRMRSVTEELASEPLTKPGMNDGTFYPEEALPITTRMRGLTPSRAVRSRPTTGTLRILVLLADFADNVGKRPAQEFSDMLFSKGTYKTGSMRDFYKENSYGQLDVEGRVLGWLRLPQSYAFYVNGDNGTGDFPNNSQKLVEDALNVAVQEGLDLSTFDTDGDAFLDGLFVVFAGGGAEDEEDKKVRAKKMWSHQFHLQTSFVSQGITAFAYCVVPEDGKVGVFSHEFGHMLGLPDLYDTTYKSLGVGNWCIMGGGEWNNGGLTPAHFCAWSKAKLNWIKPTVVKDAQSLELPSVEKNKAAVYRLWTKGKSGDEYFLIENRQKEGFDSKLPAEGLLVWHVDDSQRDNDNPGHYMVGVVQADGLRDLERGKGNGADKGDPYPGSTKNKAFGPTTNPNSNDFIGSATGVGVTNIKVKDGVVTCDVKV
ncbi:MAG: M6 family metalloprotease domain-containing protein [Pyrinomonadaceae bacterium]